MMVMGAVDGFGKSVIVSQAESTFSPFKKRILIITAVFFIILAFVGIVESFEAGSIAPLYHRTLGKIIGADHELGRYVETLAGGDVPRFEGFFVKSFPSYIWFWFLFIVNVVADLYFVFFFGWVLYELWSLLDTSKVLRNVLLAVGSYVVLSFLIGTMLFINDASGKVLPDDAVAVWLDKSYPFEGTVKFVTFFVNRDSLTRVADWSESPIGSMIVNTPQAEDNVSVS